MISNTEIAGLMVAVQRAGTSLSDEILQIVSASAEPMCCKDIYEKSSNAPDTKTLSIEVYRMTAKVGLLEIVETKKLEGSRPVAFYRLTTLGHEQLRTLGADVRKNVTRTQKTVIDVHESTQVKPNTAKTEQETTMEPSKQHGRSGSMPSPINQAIYNKIVEHPGIAHAQLIKHVLAECEGATEKKVVKTIGNMRYITGKIRAEGDRGNYTYHLNRDAAAPAPATKQKGKPERVAKVRLGKVVVGAEAAALRGEYIPAAKPASSPVEKQEVEPEFELLLSDTNCLHIKLAGEQFRLSAHQVRRLDEFLGRVLPDGVRT